MNGADDFLGLFVLTDRLVATTPAGGRGSYRCSTGDDILSSSLQIYNLIYQPAAIVTFSKTNVGAVNTIQPTFTASTCKKNKNRGCKTLINLSVKCS